jgi:hypothetical protein
MKQEMMISESPDRLLAWLEGKLVNDFPHRCEVRRPLVAQTSTVQASQDFGIFPATPLGWIFNLAMLAITFGGWAVVYLLWVVFTIGQARKLVSVVATPADQRDSTRVVLEASPDSWGEVVQGWLVERYGGQA